MPTSLMLPSRYSTSGILTKKTQILLPRRTPPQRRIDQSPTRFNIAAWGRQSGKTTWGLNKMGIKPLQSRHDSIYWFILQTYSAATIAFRRFKKQWGPLIIDKSESELLCVLKGNRNVFFKSGKNFEDLRAETLDGAIIDEVRQQDATLFSSIIRPMLTRRGGWCDFLSTTNGYDHFYDLWQLALLDPEHWSTFHAPSTEAWWWTPEEIKLTRATMTEDEFAQEILAEFREFGKGKVYSSHGLHNQSDANPFTFTGNLWTPYLPILVGLDFNVGLMCWELMQKRGNQFYIGDEIAVKNTNTAQCAKVLIEKVKGHKPGVILIGDASGKSNKTSASGETDYTILMKALKDAEIPVRNLTPESNPPIKDRVNCVNSRLKAADDSVHLWYSPTRCPRLKKDFERVTWKEGTQGVEFDKSKPELTHSSDGAGYPITHYAEEWKHEVGTLKVISN